MMEVTFRYDEDALAALVRQTPFFQRFGAILWTFAFLLLGMLAGSILPFLLGFWTSVAVCWGIFLCVVLFVLFQLVMKKPGGDVDLSQLDPITMRLDDYSWQTANTLMQSRDDWSKLSDIKTTSEHLFLFVEGVNAFVIPKLAFQSGKQAEEFATFARQRIEAAPSPADRDAPPWPVTHQDLLPETEAPDVVRGRFTPTVEEWRQEELNPVAPKEMVKTLGYIVISVGVIVLVFNGATTDAAWYMLCAAAGIMSLALAVIASQAQQRRSWRKRLPPTRLQPTQLAASPRGISLLSPTHESHITWGAYTGLRSTPEALILAGRQPSIEDLAIPQRAFANAQDIARFEALAHAHIKPDVSEAESPNITPTPETGNPYQPPLQET